MPPKRATKGPTVPDAPILPITSKPMVTAFGKASDKRASVDEIGKFARSFGALLAKDAAARASTQTLTADLAHALAALGPIDELDKTKRPKASERVRQLELLATSLRCAKNDAPLVALTVALPDGDVRGQLASILREGQIELPPSKDPALAALFEDSDDRLVMRHAFGALWDHDGAAARATAKRVLKAGDDEERITCVVAYLKVADDHAAFVPLILPLASSKTLAIAQNAAGFLGRHSSSFRTFIEWTRTRTKSDEQRRAVAVLAPTIYWVDGKEELAEPLRALRESVRKDKASVAAIDAAAKKSGIVLD